ncbi:MAG: VWA-like domain-containing protein [Conexivisphaerales archaeon]
MEIPNTTDLKVVEYYIKLASGYLGKKYPFALFKFAFPTKILSYSEETLSAIEKATKEYKLPILTTSFTDGKYVYMDPILIYNMYLAAFKTQKHFTSSQIEEVEHDGEKFYKVKNKQIEKMLFQSSLFVLMHEYLHILLEHPKRMEEKNPQIWNIAADAVVNRLITLSNIPMPPMGIPPWKDDSTTEEVYKELMKDFQGQKGNSSFSLGTGNGLSPQDVDEIAKELSKISDEVIEKLKKIFKQISKKEVQSSIAESLMKEKLKQRSQESDESNEQSGQSSMMDQLLSTIVSLANQGNFASDSLFSQDGIGRLHNLLERELDDITAVKVPYWHKIQNFLNSLLTSPGGFYQKALDVVNRLDERRPWKYAEKPTKLNTPLVIVIDTSGSMSPDQIQKIANSLYGFINSALDIMDVIIVSNDADLGKVKAVNTNVTKQRLKQILNEVLVGGGGTNFIPPFKFLEEHRIYPSAILFFTDLMSNDFPDEKTFNSPKYYKFIKDKTFWIYIDTTEEAIERLKHFSPYFGHVIDGTTSTLYQSNKIQELER